MGRSRPRLAMTLIKNGAETFPEFTSPRRPPTNPPENGPNIDPHRRGWQPQTAFAISISDVRFPDLPDERMLPAR